MKLRALVPVLALLLAGCSGGGQEPAASPTPSSSASAEDVQRAMWQCVEFLAGRDIVGSEGEARSSCETDYENHPDTFVDRYLEMYEGNYRFSDPALE